MNFFPIYSRREVTDLDGIWDFRFIPENEAPALKDFSPKGITFDTVETVPGVFDAALPYAGKRGLGIYRRTFNLVRGGRHVFTCGGFLLAARVFIDGTEIGYSELPYSKVRFEFNAKSGKHEIIAVCDNRFSATPMWLPYYDFYAFGGICRHTDIMDIPSCAIRRAAVFTLSLKGDVKIDIEFDSAVKDGPHQLSVAFDSGKAVARKVSVKSGHAVLKLRVPNPSLWSPETPNLHTVTISTKTDEITERFGLRIIEKKDAKICLNGKPVRLFGVNRHESDPDIGPALGPQQHLQDLKLLKEMNCNFIRGCHYPQNQSFLDLCDQMGFFVWEESLGWGNLKEQLNSRPFFDDQVESTRMMVRESINHPSVVLWGFLNEGDSSSPQARPLYQKLADTIRENDSSRLVTFASNRYELDVCLEFADVISMNVYPGWYGTTCDKPDQTDLIPACIERFAKLVNQPEYSDKPLIMSEIGAGAIYGCHDRFESHWSEEYQAKLIGCVADNVIANERYSGLAFWHFADARTYVSSVSRPRGFNNKGILDEYRRPKLAFYTIKEKFGSEFKQL